MATYEPVSVKQKLVDVVVAEREFKADDGNLVKYQRLVAVVEYEGVIEEIEFTPSQGKLALRLIQLADDQE